MISLELKKEKRTGLTTVLLVSVILGAAYVLVNFAIRGDSLLSMPADPMDILLTQLYGIMMVLNMFAIVVAASIAYNMEYSGSAVKKMYVLPISMKKIYSSKFLIILTAFLISVAFEGVAFAWIGTNKLGAGVFRTDVFLLFMLYTYITSLPVASFMLFISSLSENIWVTIGIGVGGFLSGMALVNMNDSILMMLHPFIVMFKPAVAMSANINWTVMGVAIAETIVFFIVGIIGSSVKKAE
ncbi:MAG: ABC transporter permease [Lachnospiraceae bacterium]|nr:ABC transporter permease [Lachnospiraceae bacterium]